MKGKRVIHHVKTPSAYRNGVWTYSEEDRAVIVLAVSGGWAMVRRPRCVPYVARVSELAGAVDRHDGTSNA